MPAKQQSIESQVREAFSREAESVLLCLFYARRADVEGRADIAAALRSIADGEVSQAFGHLELLEELGAEVGGGSDAAGDLAAVVEAEEAAVERYRLMETGARRAGHTAAADWFGSLAAAESVHVGVLRRVAPAGG